MRESELRQDRTSGRWVIIAPQRLARPRAYTSTSRVSPDEAPSRINRACPFCPGNESELPGITAQVPAEGAPGWTVRVVPNKYPAVHALTTGHAPLCQEYLLEGYGFHEVIVESPLHDADLVSIGDAEIDAVVATYRDRCAHLIAQPGIEAVILFRNHGPGGGASIPHPHAQIVALGLVPPNVALLADWGRSYHNAHGRCPTCDEIARAGEPARRVVEDTGNFVAIVPFAAEHPFEIWIVPKRHQASFVELDDAHVRELSTLLRRTLRRLRLVRDDPAYNFVIDSADRQHLDAPYAHWRLRISPKLTTRGGFELATGMSINPSVPEDDAAALRAVSTRVELNKGWLDASATRQALDRDQ